MGLLRCDVTEILDIDTVEDRVAQQSLSFLAIMDTEPPLSLQQSHLSQSTVLQNERQVVRQAGRQAIVQFLEQHSCFSVLRTSGKVVVFDIRIPIQLAFYALVEHGRWKLLRIIRLPMYFY